MNVAKQSIIRCTIRLKRGLCFHLAKPYPVALKYIMKFTDKGIQEVE